MPVIERSRVGERARDVASTRVRPSAASQLRVALLTALAALGAVLLVLGVLLG